jgi:drug/metabolite transporter (DMT)-like permease
MRKKLDTRTVMAIAIAILFWASSFASVGAALDEFSPGSIAVFRFGVASLVLLLIALLRKISLPDRKDVPFFLVLGFFGITVYHLAQNYGQTTVTAGSASLIIASVPIFTALLAKAFLKERLSGRGWLGIFISLAGIAIISWGEGDEYAIDAGALLMILAAVSVSLFFVFQKYLHNRYSPLQITTYSIWSGTLYLLVFLPGLLAEINDATVGNIINMVYLGVFPGALAYLAWNYALSKTPASILTSVLNISPVPAIIIAWIWLNEIPTALAIIGGTVAIAGVLVVNRYGMTGTKSS